MTAPAAEVLATLTIDTAGAQRQVRIQMVRAATTAGEEGGRQFGRSFGRNADAGMAAGLRGLRSNLALAGAAATTFGVAAGVRMASQVEAAGISLKSLLPVGTDVEALLGRLRQQALASPVFRVADVTKFTQQLVGAQVPLGQTEAVLKSLGAVFLTFGTNAEQAERVMYAITQVAGKGKLASEEWRQQILEAVPAFGSVLPRAMGITNTQFQELLTTGQISSDMFLRAVVSAGRLPEVLNAAAGATNSLSAKWQELKERLTGRISDVVTNNLDGIKSGLDAVGDTASAVIDVAGVAANAAGAALTPLVAGIHAVGPESLLAVAGIALLGRTISSSLRSPTSALSNLRAGIELVASASESGMSRTRVAFTLAGGAMRAFRAGAGNLVAFMGGPFAVGLEVATIGIGAMVSAHQEAVAAAEGQRAAFQGLVETYAQGGAKLNAKGASDFFVQLSKDAELSGADLQGALDAAGISVNEFYAAALKGGDEYNQLLGRLDERVAQIKDKYGSGTLDFFNLNNKNDQAEWLQNVVNVGRNYQAQNERVAAANRAAGVSAAGAAGATDDFGSALGYTGRQAAVADTFLADLVDKMIEYRSGQMKTADLESDRQHAIAGLNDMFAKSAKDAGEAARAARDYADQMLSARRSIRNASEGIADAKYNEREAERSLVETRREQVRTLQDMRREGQRSALSEEGALISLIEAREEYNRVFAKTPGGGLGDLGNVQALIRSGAVLGKQSGNAITTDLDRRKAALRLKEAQLQLSDVQFGNKRAAEDLARANQDGVEGSSAMRGALRGLEQAHRGVRDAQEGYTDAVRNLTRVQQDAAEKSRTVSEVQSRSLDTVTGAGLRNRDAIKAIAQANYDLYTDALKRNPLDVDAKRKLDERNAALLTQAQRLGFSRSEAELLIGTYGGFKDVKIGFSTLNFEAVQAQLAGLMVAQGTLFGPAKYVAGLTSTLLRTAILTAINADKIPKKRDGGRLTGPGTGTSDSILIRASAGEYVVNAASTARNLALLEAINRDSDGGFPQVRHPGDGDRWAFAQGGLVAPFKVNLSGASFPSRADIAAALSGDVATSYTGPMTANVARAQKFVRAQAGKPYLWANVGPDGYDCSGILSAVVGVLKGLNPFVRRFSTATMADVTKPGADPAGLTAGWGLPGERGASPGVGHTAGLLAGLAFESRGGDGVVVGPRATSVNRFARVGHFDNGGWLDQLGVNTTGQPEAVLDPGQSQAFLQFVDVLSSGGIRLDSWTIARIAQAVSARPAVVAVDGDVVARTVDHHLAREFVVAGS